MDRFEQPMTPMRQGPGRRGVTAAGLLVAVVVLGGIVLARQPSSGPAPSPVASVAMASSQPSPSSALPLPGSTNPWHGDGDTPPRSPTPVPTAKPAYTVPPTYPPDAFVDAPEWRVNLYGVAALVIDPERRVVGAGTAAYRYFTFGFKGGVLPADSDHAVDLYWISSRCAAFETVTLGPDGTITVNTTTPDAVCKPGPSMQALELRFASKVNAKDFSLVVGPENHYPPDYSPVAVAFSDTKHGVAAIANGRAGVAETFDGGQSWRYTILGDGSATGVALAGQTVWTAISCDPSVFDHCAAGVYRRSGGVWERMLDIDPGPMAVEGHSVAVLWRGFADGGAVAPSPTEIRLSHNDGGLWTRIPNPCPAAEPTLTAVAFGDPGPMVVCEAVSETADAEKVLLASADSEGATWVQRSQLPPAGSGMGLSTRPGGVGLLWGDGSPLLATPDGGATWTALAKVADGMVRIVRSANAGTGKAISALVWDPSRASALVLVSTDGARTWTEHAAFREMPCCGG